MKKFILFFACISIAVTSFSQESLIRDLLTIKPLIFSIEEMNKETNNQYQTKLDEQLLEATTELAKYEKEFREDVEETITAYNEVLATGNEKEVNSEKRIASTSVYTASMILLKNKKNVLINLNSKMTSEIRKLPTTLVNEKEEELKQILADHKEAFHAEFNANEELIRMFEETKHLQIEN